MAERILQSTTKRVSFEAYLSSDHVTPATGLTIGITISKNGAAFANPSGGATSATSIGSGSYYVDLTTTDTNTLGPLIVFGAVATMDNMKAHFTVIDANTGGYGNLDAAVSTRTKPADTQAAVTVCGSVTGSVGSVTGAVGSVTGAVGSVTGNLGGNVVGNVNGSVGSVVGSVGGSVASVTGAVGSVTGNVGGSVASVTGAVGSVTGNVGGNVVGSVGSVAGNVTGSVASVTGAVGSVTGSVGSVTGNVGGNVTGTVASVVGNLGGSVLGNVNGSVGSVTGSVGSVTGGVGGSVASVTAPVSIATNQLFIKKNTAFLLSFPMTDSTNHLPATGLTVAASRTIDGGAVSACANSVVELTGGLYRILLAATDTNGAQITLALSATGADTRWIGLVTQA